MPGRDRGNPVPPTSLFARGAPHQPVAKAPSGEGSSFHGAPARHAEGWRAQRKKLCVSLFLSLSLALSLSLSIILRIIIIVIIIVIIVIIVIVIIIIIVIVVVIHIVIVIIIRKQKGQNL